MVVKIPFPKNASLSVSVGQKVKINDPFYASSEETEVEISVDKELGIKPKEIFQCIKVVIGDELKEGDLVAEKKKLLGRKKILSKDNARVSHIDHESGRIVLTTSTQSELSKSTFFTGEIKEIDEDKGQISIDIGPGTEYKATLNEDFGGEISCIDSIEFYSLDEESIKDRIILLHTVQSHFTTKLEALGAKGIVYVKGSFETELPSAKISAEDYEDMKSSKKSYIIFSTVSKSGFTYN